MSRPIILLLLIFVCSTLLVLLFYGLGMGGEQGMGGFRRFVHQIPLERMRVVELGANGYYFAGSTKRNVFLAHPSSPYHILVMESGELHPREIDPNGFTIHASKLSIDSPFFYLADAVSYSIFRGTLQTMRVDTALYDSIFFSEAVILGQRSVVRRTISQHGYEYTLSREDPDTVIYNDRLLQKQIDGLFCTDGMLHYDGKNRIVYVYFYRNQFICTDTTLSPLFRGRTIDTTAHAAIEVSAIKSKNSITLASPPFIVNRRSSVAGDKLYINSGVRSDEEDSRRFREKSVIDVYHLERAGRYEYSFYLPDYNGLKMKSFAVVHRNLYSVQGRFLLIYRMPDGMG